MFPLTAAITKKIFFLDVFLSKVIQIIFRSFWQPKDKCLSMKERKGLVSILQRKMIIFFSEMHVMIERYFLLEKTSEAF